MFTTGETVGLAEWIIDDTCLVPFFWVPLKATYFKSQQKMLVMQVDTLQISNPVEISGIANSLRLQ